jgi:hypothetical protein
MARTLVCLLVCLLAGCESGTVATGNGGEMFAPTTMRIHPIFTQLSDLNHTGKPDGIEAQLEFFDEFGDSTKASGRVLFELFDYRKDSPDPRGRRVHDPWIGSIATPEEQKASWNTTLRTYRFALPDPAISPTQNYVLTAIFEKTGGGRFPVGRSILTAQPVNDTKKAKATPEEPTGPPVKP